MTDLEKSKEVAKACFEHSNYLELENGNDFSITLLRDAATEIGRLLYDLQELQHVYKAEIEKSKRNHPSQFVSPATVTGNFASDKWAGNNVYQFPSRGIGELYREEARNSVDDLTD